MVKKWIILLFVLAAAVLVVVPGCSKKSGSKTSNVALTPESSENTAAGVTWSYPSRWTKGAPRAMRVVTYVVPAAPGDSEPGECVVFFFGSGAGGDVDMNIQRWSQQFDGAPAPSRTDDVINGIKVAKVMIAGAYLAPAGPMMESQGKKENYRLFGAIVEAPEGRVFFKFTGPAKTVEAAGAEFDALLGSLTKK